MNGLLRIALPISLMLLAAGCVRTGDVKPRTQAVPEEAAAINLQLGVAYMRKGQYRRALDSLERAVKQNPDLPAAQSALALVLEQLGDAEAADKHYRRAVRLAGEDAGVRNMYGTYLCRHGRVEEGEKHFVAAAQNPRYPTPEIAYTNAGTCLSSIEDYGRAEFYYRKALSENKNYSEALWKMAELAFSRDRDIQARAFIQRYEAAVRRPPAGALWLGHRIESRLGDAAAVRRYAQLLKKEFPASTETGLLLELEKHGG